MKNEELPAGLTEETTTQGVDRHVALTDDCHKGSGLVPGLDPSYLEKMGAARERDPLEGNHARRRWREAGGVAHPELVGVLKPTQVSDEPLEPQRYERPALNPPQVFGRRSG